MKLLLPFADEGCEAQRGFCMYPHSHSSWLGWCQDWTSNLPDSTAVVVPQPLVHASDPILLLLTIRHFSKSKVNNIWVINWILVAKHLYRSLTKIRSQCILFGMGSVQFSCSVMSYSLWPHELQHARPPCPSPTPGVHSNSRPSSRWCPPVISSSVVPFSSCPQSLPASESFRMSQLFAWGGQSTGVSALASFLPKKSQGWSPSEWTGWISL